MALQASYFSKTFYFCFTARTSRGKMSHRTSWFIKISEPGHSSYMGIGEVAPLPGLSKEYSPFFEKILLQAVDRFNREKVDVSALKKTNLVAIRFLLQNHLPQILTHASLLFAFESALLDFAHGGHRLILKNNSFVQGRAIPINGLVWMDEVENMWQKAQELIKQGFPCIKIKVGGVDFEQECNMLRRIRRSYNRQQVILRLDANGAFRSDDVYSKLEALHRFGIHSIEQPLSPGARDMAALCAHSPIPIALDEELIGVDTLEQKEALLRKLKPKFIILKPTLHGGLYGCGEWIELANAMGIGWWGTSALESNVGLNAIAQFIGSFDDILVQGLGTGSIYKNNIGSPLFIRKGKLLHDRRTKWEI